MVTKKSISAADFMPNKKSLPSLRNAAQDCRGCPLYKNATQTVFGEGAAKSELVIVGEIPGDKEDQTGHPFTGPAGMLLRQSLKKFGIDWENIYITNVVKHFKFERVKNRRLHRSPNVSEIHACEPWLDAEIQVIKPKIILCLGAVAAKTLISKQFQLLKQRGKWQETSPDYRILATYHPSAILRASDEESRDKMKRLFLKDLKKVVEEL